LQDAPAGGIFNSIPRTGLSPTTPGRASLRYRSLDPIREALTAEMGSVERESAVKIAEQLDKRNRELRARVDMLIVAHQNSGHEASAMAYEVEADRRRLEEENAQFKDRIAALETSTSEINRASQRLREEIGARGQHVEQLKVHVAALQERNSALEVTNVMLRGENASITDSASDLEHSLRMAEDARSRLEQANLALEARDTGGIEELERLRIESSRAVGENEQLVSEIERLNGEITRLQGGGTRIGEDNARLLVSNAELSQAHALAQSRADELDRESAALRTQLEEARSLVGGRLVELEKENAILIQTRTRLEGEAARMTARTAELVQENQTLTESH
jgi:predicted nuclease with TOPRIM domain